MSVSLKRSLLLKAYPLPKSTFVQISNILLTEYRKRTIPLYKDVRTNDLDGGALQDFREDRNPPIRVSYSIISDGIQQVLTEPEFDRVSEKFDYERCAVCVNLNCGNALLHFDAHLDGRLSLHLQDCTTFTKLQARVFLCMVSARICAFLRKRKAEQPKHTVQGDPTAKQERKDRPSIKRVFRLVFRCLIWIFLAVLSAIISLVVSAVLNEDVAAWVKSFM